MSMKYLEKLDPQPKYYVFLTNNVVDNTLNVLNKWKSNHPNTEIIHLNFPKDFVTKLGTPYGPIAIVRQTLLDKARDLGVDYAIFLDDDIFVADKQFIATITSFNLDIVGGAYFRTYPMGDLMSYLAKNESGKKAHCPYILRNYQLHKLFKVMAVGGGCQCISKKVINDLSLNFYPIVEYNLNTPACSEDFGYCIEAGRKGYEVWCYDDFKLCHYQIHVARPWRMKNDKEYVNFEY